MSFRKETPRALTIAGHDCSGGAGTPVDLKTFEHWGVYGLAALTAVTVQTPEAVFAVEPLSPHLVYQQVRTAAALGVSVAKTGMLGESEVVLAVARAVRDARVEALVVDPVLHSSSGTPLLSKEGWAVLSGELFPQALLVTPNRAEAEALSGVPLDSEQSFLEAAEAIAATGAQAVLLKGRRRREERVVCDGLYYKGELKWLTYPYLEGLSLHGTGCRLSAAIAACLARGEDLVTSVRLARAWLQGILERAAAGELV